MRPAEETVVRQCAPTLAGIKTGSLFPCPYDSRQQLLADIRRMNRVLVPRGLCLLPMRLGQGRALLYLYRPQALRRDLDDDLSCRLLRQAGLVPEDFEIYTTYEASTFCKPNPAYYLEVARTLGVKPEECLMVGNDATEDMAAREVGMDVFLLTDCLINAKNRDLNAYPRGDFAALNAYIDALQ